MPAKDQHNLVRRPPVVVVMGHIDHGKSTLLDRIRKSNVVAGEAGGITQHVGAYQAEHVSADGARHPVTFLGTPGHAAFGGIRTRGAQAADIAILAVSAEDGVKPQTVEAYKVIKSFDIPFVVAITKIDKPNANVDKAKTSLGEHEIYVEGWGGDIPCVAVSAVSGAGVPELLDMIMLVADLADLKTDPGAPASGIIIESELDTRKGISATLLIKDGTLTAGSVVVAGGSFAPVRYIEDFLGKKIPSAAASMPAVIVGWNQIPAVGLEFSIAKNKKEAEDVAEQFREKAKAEKKAEADATAIASSASPAAEGDAPAVVTLPLVIKADVIGSLEGVKYELAKLDHDKVKLKIVSEGIGEINENDVKLVLGDPEILLIGFNVMPDKKAAAMIERASFPMNVGSFTIIYKLSEFIQEKILARVPKEYIEEMTGRAKILALFSKEKDRQVIGGKVESGMIASGNDVRIMRRESEIGRGKIRELQAKKVRTQEVAEGHEFGMLVEAKVEIAPGDRIEAVRTVEKKS